RRTKPSPTPSRARRLRRRALPRSGNLYKTKMQSIFVLRRASVADASMDLAAARRADPAPPPPLQGALLHSGHHHHPADPDGEDGDRHDVEVGRHVMPSSAREGAPGRTTLCAADRIRACTAP